MTEPIDAVRRYHEATKHHVGRYARSLGYLDWAAQPRPFRAFDGSPQVTLYPRPDAVRPARPFPPVSYDSVWDGASSPPSPVDAASIGDLLRHALGLSAWKAYGASRWALRVNPSSGNLHPTEAYVVTGAVEGLADSPGVWHYAPEQHALEQRCAFDASGWRTAGIGHPDEALLIVLTSIHWREAWKYGERAFRYCQHDIGHAIAALAMSAALHGWRVDVAPHWSHSKIAALVGIDREADFVEAEPEEAACLLLVTRHGQRPQASLPAAGLLDAVRSGRWFGRASQLSEDHVQWTIIDEVARATAVDDHGGHASGPEALARPRLVDSGKAGQPVQIARGRPVDLRGLVLQRRSAVAFDGISSIGRDVFLHMLGRTLPSAQPPWRALGWAPAVHLAIFVHRVRDLEPGLYLLPRTASAEVQLRSDLGREFAWERVAGGLPLWLLQPGGCRALAKRVSCDQDIAADGCFSLGMVAAFEPSLSEHGASFYRNLFWEAGAIGQVLYLEAEAAGVRGTGIGCFFDDAMHEILGIPGLAWQSLYHFTVGVPVDDGRLMTEPGYRWEAE